MPDKLIQNHDIWTQNINISKDDTITMPDCCLLQCRMVSTTVLYGCHALVSAALAFKAHAVRRAVRQQQSDHILMWLQCYGQGHSEASCQLEDMLPVLAPQLFAVQNGLLSAYIPCVCMFTCISLSSCWGLAYCTFIACLCVFTAACCVCILCARQLRMCDCMTAAIVCVCVCVCVPSHVL